MGCKTAVKELVSQESVEKILLLLAVGGPLVGVILGTMVGAHERCALPKVIAGALIGSLLTVAYGMWRLFEVITNMLGLDSVANLIIELVLFAVAGLVVALVASRIAVLIKKPW
ncbi:MAG: hypothetical protein N3B12_05930 [Armatimonadetes bacterium]|nr:hypothetical protein [Armatimonadota bacterium]